MSSSRSTFTTAHLMCKELAGLGVTRMFGIPGGPISPVLDALLDLALPFVSATHEAMATYMAAGYGEATGELAVVATTSGPGVLNALGAIAGANLDQRPLLMLVGEVAERAHGRGAMQDGTSAGLDLAQVARPLCRYVGVVDRPEHALAELHRAIDAARSRPGGVALLRIPLDVGRAEAKPGIVRIAPRCRVSDDSMRAALDTVALRLSAARRAVIFVGGAIARARLGATVQRLADHLGAAVITDLEAKGVVAEDHALSRGVFGAGGDGRAVRALQGADLVLVVGARMDDTTTANFSPALRPENGTLIQLDDDMARLNRAFSADVALCGDLGDMLETLAQLTCAAAVRTPGALPEGPGVLPPRLGGLPHDPRAVVAALQRHAPADACFTSDIGNHLLFTGMGLRLGPGRFYASMGLGGMGSGFGYAIGWQLGLADRRRVVAIVGDGTLLMWGNEIATCARLGIPLVVAAFHDGQWGMVQHGAEAVYGRAHDWSLPRVDLVRWAESLGAKAVPAIDDDAFALAGRWAGPGPLLLDIPIDPSVRVPNPRDEILHFGARTHRASHPANGDRAT